MVSSLRDSFNKVKLQSPFCLHFQKILPDLELERSVAIHNLTHKDLDWMRGGILPTHNYTAVIREARQPPSGPPTPTQLPTKETDDQNFSQALLQMIRKWISGG